MRNSPLSTTDFSDMEAIIRESYPGIGIKNYLENLYERFPKAFVVSRGMDGKIFGLAVIVPVTSQYAANFESGKFAGINYAPFPEDAIAPREIPYQQVILDGIFVAKKSRGLGTHTLMKGIAGLIHERKVNGLPISRIIALADIPTGHQFYSKGLEMEHIMSFGNDIAIYAATAEDFIKGWFENGLYGKISAKL
jgi:hypothetical protein